MIAPSSLVATLALGAALVASSADAGALPTGVCYSPWHHGSVNADIIQKDFAQVKQYFSGVRTYHAQFAGINVAEMASKAGIKVSIGVQMGNEGDIQKELDAACKGAKDFGASVESIYVGNENLKNGDFGKYSGSQLAGYITQLRTCIGNASIKIGSVQRINEWVGASDAAALAAASDVIGVNIYPFFTPGPQSPIEKLEIQWKEVNAKYPGGKVHITETGYPRGGSSGVAGNSPSKEIATSFLSDYASWAKNQPTSYWFMMYDTKGNSPDYENFFGLADVNGVVQLAIPSGDGAAVPQAPAPQAPAPAPQAPATQAPVPQAPATQAPAAPQAPATQAPSPAAQVPVPAAPQTPANGDGDDVDDDEDDSADGGAGAVPGVPAAVPGVPAGVPAGAPAATPAASKPGKKDCHA